MAELARVDRFHIGSRPEHLDERAGGDDDETAYQVGVAGYVPPDQKIIATAEDGSHAADDGELARVTVFVTDGQQYLAQGGEQGHEDQENEGPRGGPNKALKDKRRDHYQGHAVEPEDDGQVVFGSGQLVDSDICQGGEQGRAEGDERRRVEDELTGLHYQGHSEYGNQGQENVYLGDLFAQKKRGQGEYENRRRLIEKHGIANRNARNGKKEHDQGNRTDHSPYQQETFLCALERNFLTLGHEDYDR